METSPATTLPQWSASSNANESAISAAQWQSIHSLSLSLHRAGNMAEAIALMIESLHDLLAADQITEKIESVDKTSVSHHSHPIQPFQSETNRRYSHLESTITLPRDQILSIEAHYSESPASADLRILRVISEHLSVAVRHLPNPVSLEDENSPLSRREKEVMPLLIMGRTNDEIGLLLGISHRTVEKHVSAILEKTGLDNRKLLIASFQRKTW